MTLIKTRMLDGSSHIPFPPPREFSQPYSGRAISDLVWLGSPGIGYDGHPYMQGTSIPFLLPDSQKLSMNDCYWSKHK